MPAAAGLTRPPPTIRTWVLPVVLGVVASSEAALSSEISSGSALPAVLAAAMALPLAWRDVQPLGGLTAILAVFAVQEVAGPGTLSEAVMPFIVLVIAMYSAGARLRGASLAVAALISSLAITGTIVFDSGLDADSLVYALLVVAAAFGAGRLVGQRNREVGRLADEKAQLVRDREERERAAVARERMRIAQELHDLITHRVSAMVLQAATERRIAERGKGARLDASALAATLESIETLGREAMSELRQLLGALFHEGDDPRAPQPRAEDVQTLVAQTAGAGVDIEFEILGDSRALPPRVEVSLYRLTQEALSNAMRHAPRSRVRVELDYTPDAVALTVTNSPGDGDGPGDVGLGLGIPGMRERVRQFGGSLLAEETRDGGFEVRARLPTLAEQDAGQLR